MEKIKCGNCKSSYDLDDFMKEGKQLKTCIKCRENKNKRRPRCVHDKRKDSCIICSGCEHKKQKHLCVDCNGTSICEHKKIKSKCVACNGASICEHKKQRTRCVACNGASICEHKKIRIRCKLCTESFDVIINNWLRDCRQFDKKKGRFDPDHFIDKDFLRGLLEDYPRCYYEECRVKFEYVKHCDKLVSIDQINHKLGYIKSNCILACFSCNNKRNLALHD